MIHKTLDTFLSPLSETLIKTLDAMPSTKTAYLLTAGNMTPSRTLKQT